MISVSLSEEDWKRLTALLATKCLWIEANPFLVAIGQQLGARTAAGRPNGADRDADPPDWPKTIQPPS
jgi:hypothetical protein